MKRHQARTNQARAAFDKENRNREEIIRQRAVAFTSMKQEVDGYNNSIVGLAKNYVAGEPIGVGDYFEFVMRLSKYPDPISLEPKAAYVKESKQLVVEIELPTISDAIPSVEKYRYVKKTNEIVEAPRSDKSRNSIYIDLISQIVIRCLYELCRADTHQVVETTVLNAFVSTLDPATGHRIRPCLISVRISRDVFLGFDLRHVEPSACLKQLRASVSSQPGELLAVKPILDLKMVDPRFIQEENVLSTLDQRPNLMELSPKEFESLITNLFSKMGLETRQTQASRDGGVDCVAFDSRPILGGKVVIQAKRYKNTVGVAAVRDLFGTLHNEGASKGILVTTSGYGKSSYEFANGKPIELITGSNLLYLLKEQAGVEAKIEAPVDWVDPSLELD
jgi:restriction system protein